MSQDTLKTFRLLIPGIIAVLIGYYYLTILTGKDFNQLDFKDFSYPLLAAVCIGTFFYLSDIRFLITNYSHKKIDLNIKNHIIKLYTKPISDKDKQFLFQKNRLKDIFYNIVDNDESLKNKAKNVYFNGLIWTSTADLMIISLFSAIIFLISAFIFKSSKNELIEGCFLLIIISLISIALHYLSVLKHINLSNEQIGYIETHKLTQVDSLVSKVLEQNNESV